MDDQLEKIKSALTQITSTQFSEKDNDISNDDMLDTIDWKTFLMNTKPIEDDMLGNIDYKTFNAIPSVTITSQGSGYKSAGPTGNNIITNSAIGANGAANFNSIPNSLTVEGTAKFNGDIIWKNQNLGVLLETIERRLAILIPDPEKLIHYEALQKAYDHYKTLEALCAPPNKQEEK
jgi:hypothetical protein